MTYEPADYRQEAPPRVMGEEYELSPATRFAINSLPKKIIRYAGYTSFQDRRTRQVWLQNGMNMHTEITDLCEIAGPEGFGPESATVNGEACLQTVRDIVGSPPFQEAHPKLNIFHSGGNFTYDSEGARQVYGKRAVNLSLMSVEHDSMDTLSLQMLLNTHFATASWAGAGLLSPNGFELFQRSSLGSYNNQGSITKIHHGKKGDDVLSDGWIRAERRVGDATRSTFVNFTQHTAASLVARIFEHQKKFTPAENSTFQGHMLQNPGFSMPVIAADLTLSERLACVDGESRTGLHIQQLFIDRVHELIKKGVALPEDELRGLACWEKLIGIMSRSNLLGGDLIADLKEASRYMHWALHARRLAKIAAACNTSPDKPSTWSSWMTRLNLESNWLGRITPVDSLGKVAVKTAEGVIDNFKEKIAARTASGEGRAAARGAIVELISKNPGVADRVSMSWKTIVYVDERGKSHPFYLDPFDPNPPQKLVALLAE